MDSFKKRLMELQHELKAPKNLYNNFGKYKYRNAEGILEAVKPMLKKYNMTMIISDEIVQIGERYYIKAVVTLFDVESDDYMSAEALARESLDKKGMDDSQITGTASSYARKYALNGLFLLDDTKDADSDEYHEQTNNESQLKDVITAEQMGKIKLELLRTGVTEEQICETYEVKSLNDFTQEFAEHCLKKLSITKDKK